MNIAEKLKKFRMTKNITVYQLSKMSGVSETHIRDLERGDRNPSFDTLACLAESLGISLPELFNEDADIMYLNNKEKEVVDCFRLLSEEKSESLLGFLKTLI